MTCRLESFPRIVTLSVAVTMLTSSLAMAQNFPKAGRNPSLADDNEFVVVKVPGLLAATADDGWSRVLGLASSTRVAVTVIGGGTEQGQIIAADQDSLTLSSPMGRHMIERSRVASVKITGTRSLWLRVPVIVLAPPVAAGACRAGQGPEARPLCICRLHVQRDHSQQRRRRPHPLRRDQDDSGPHRPIFLGSAGYVFMFSGLGESSRHKK